MKELECEVREIPGVKSAVAVDLTGGVFASNLEELRETIQIQEAGRISDLILNFGGLDFISSSGIGLLVEKNEEFRKCKKRLWVVGLNPDIERIFQQFSLDEILRIMPEENHVVEEIKRLNP